MSTTTREACWTEGCDEPQSDERLGYWCTRHHDERRERITRHMASIQNDSMGNPRTPAGTHDISIRTAYAYLYERDVWWWKCTCGKESASGAKSEGMARAASYRHLRAVEKAEARA